MNDPSTVSNLTGVHIGKYESPLGLVLAGATEAGLCYLEFLDEPTNYLHLNAFCAKWRLVANEESNIFLDRLGVQLEEYFSKGFKQFDLTLHLMGTEFQQKVWNQLLQIPYGQATSYEGLSIGMGQPLAIRAIAQANGKNPIAIVIPCHRVIGKSGLLTGYAGGMWRKKWLLEHEHEGFIQMKMEL